MNTLKIICIIWLLSEVLLNRLMRAKETDKQNVDNRSLLWIWITIIVSISAAVTISATRYDPISTNPNLIYVGMGLLLLGIVLRLLVIRSMGQHFTVDVTIKKDHVLKTDGFFTYLRHPSYFASFLSFVGFGLCLNNWISLSIIIVCMLFSFIRRIQVEEAVLTEQFGQAYIDYAKNTKRLIPFIY